MKKIFARILITGYEDPVKGDVCDFGYDGDNKEIVAMLLKCAVMICQEDLHFSDEQILDLLIKECLQPPGDDHDR